MERCFEGPWGRVTVEERGNQAVFRACRPLSGPGLWKAWIWGERGRYLLGTLIPEGESLRLGRTIPRAQLERQGAWPPLGAEILRWGEAAGGTGLPEGWSWRERPSGLTGDPLLSRCLEAFDRVLYREEAGGFLLALPWSPERCFPLTPLFCLGKMASLDGRKGEFSVLFFFDSKGRPRLKKKE